MESSEAENSQPVGPGLTLRDAREAAGIAPREMADRLNWLPSHLTAIEDNRFEDLRSQAFVRGYLRAYAKALGLEEQPLVERYNALAEHQPRNNEGQAAASSAASTGQQNSAQWIVASLLFAVLIVFIFWWRGQPAPEADAPQLAEPTAVTGEEIAISPAESEDTVASNTAGQAAMPADSAVQGDETSGDAPGPTMGAAADAVSDSPIGQASPPVMELRPSSPGTPEPEKALSAAGSVGEYSARNVLEFSFSGECWLEVKDGNDQLIYSDLKAAGDTLSLRGEPPFKIVAGNASAVLLQYRGERIAVTSPPGRNLARVTVGERPADSVTATETAAQAEASAP